LVPSDETPTQLSKCFIQPAYTDWKRFLTRNLGVIRKLPHAFGGGGVEEFVTVQKQKKNSVLKICDMGGGWGFKKVSFLRDLNYKWLFMCNQNLNLNENLVDFNSGAYLGWFLREFFLYLIWINEVMVFKKIGRGGWPFSLDTLLLMCQTSNFLKFLNLKFLSQIIWILVRRIARRDKNFGYAHVTSQNFKI